MKWHRIIIEISYKNNNSSMTEVFQALLLQSANDGLQSTPYEQHPMIFEEP